MPAFGPPLMAGLAQREAVQKLLRAKVAPTMIRFAIRVKHLYYIITLLGLCWAKLVRRAKRPFELLHSLTGAPTQPGHPP